MTSNLPNFWQKIPKPIICLAPMDGVTDISFRHIISKTYCPDILFTEFVNVDSIIKGAWQQLEPLRYDPEYRPIIAQVYGSDPKNFYKIAHLICEMGFDGIDINMGCPAKKIANRGAGAGLIAYPEIAKKIIHETKRGVQDWCDGQSLEKLDFPKKVLKKFIELNLKNTHPKKIPIPVSVKTRLGIEKIVIEDWVLNLLEEQPVAISIHGRTLKQMYTGVANWEMIAKASEIIHQTNTLCLGNGDLRSLDDCVKKINLANVDGILIGREAIGKPWIFQEISHLKSNPNHLEKITPLDTLAMMEKHLDIIKALDGSHRALKIFRHVRKYCRHLPFNKEEQNLFFQAKSADDFQKTIYFFRKKLEKI